jgi:hypothetical protein
MTEARVARCATLRATAPRSVGKSNKLVEQHREQLKQQHNDGAPSHQREGKQKEDPEEDKEDGLGFQKVKRDLRAVYDHFDNERHKTMYVMFGDSWDMTSRRIIKNLR